MIEKCLVCHSDQVRKVMDITDHLVSHESFILKECEQCKFRFISDPPEADVAYKYYETEEYVEHSDSSEGLINIVYHRARRWMLQYKYRIMKKAGRTQKLLDFGTGTGYFINFMKTKGFQVHGVEISDKARKFGKESFQLDIHHPNDIYSDSFPTKFGYITFWHVLEHIYNPDEVLNRVRELMDDQGLLIVALPNYDCLEEKIYLNYWNGYDIPRHLWHWNKSSFIQYMERLGFQIKRTGMLPLDPFYNGLISESYRKKTWAHILIPFIGITSLLRGWLNHEKASSIVYYFEKA